MQSSPLIVMPDTYVYMAWNWKGACWELSRNGIRHCCPKTEAHITCCNERYREWKQITRRYRLLRVHGSQELLQYFTRAMAQWTSRSSNQFRHESLMVLSRTNIVIIDVMAESGLGDWFWFKSAVAGCETLNVTYKARIGTTTLKLMHGETSDLSRLCALGYSSTWNLKDEKKAMIRSWQVKLSTLDLSPVPVRIHSSFRKGIQWRLPIKRNLMRQYCRSGAKKYSKNTRFCFEQYQMSNRSLTISYTLATIQGFILIWQVIWSWLVLIR